MSIEKSKKVLPNLFSQHQNPALVRLRANEKVKQWAPQNRTSASFVALQIALNESTIPHVISTLNTLTPSLSYPKSTRCRITQAHQIQAAKQAESPVVFKMQLAHLAQLSPSAIHTSDIRKGYE